MMSPWQRLLFTAACDLWLVAVACGLIALAVAVAIGRKK